MRSLLVCLLVTLAAPAAAQDAFPARPLSPEKELNFPWMRGERFVVEESPTLGAYRYRVGQTPDGYSYRVWSNGNAGLAGYGENWSINCQVDAMTDQFGCSVVSLTNTAVGVFFGTSNSPLAICVIGHDFPGKAAAIRVDQHPARYTDTKGCIGPEIVSELTTGQVVRTRAVKWPYEQAVDRGGTLAGLNQSFGLVRHLQAHFKAMNF